MKVILILWGALLFLFFASVGIVCCKVSGDSEEDARRCFERRVNEKNSKTAPKESEGGLA